MKENKVSNLFRANTDSISDVNKRNILSTWKTILGGLKNHKKNDFVNKYQLEVELSKDISIKKINKITLKHNQIFNDRYKRFFIKKFSSNIFERIVVK